MSKYHNDYITSKPKLSRSHEDAVASVAPERRLLMGELKRLIGWRKGPSRDSGGLFLPF